MELECSGSLGEKRAVIDRTVAISLNVDDFAVLGENVRAASHRALWAEVLHSHALLFDIRRRQLKPLQNPLSTLIRAERIIHPVEDAIHTAFGLFRGRIPPIGPAPMPRRER